MEFHNGTASLAALGAATCKVDYIKVGLWGLKTEAEATFLLQPIRQTVCRSSHLPSAGRRPLGAERVRRLCVIIRA